MYCLMIQAKQLEFSENCSQEEVADELFDEIVQQAEKDSEHYVRVCYCVALRYALCGPRYMGKAKRFLNAAEQADRDRLPIFDDNDVSSLRTFAKDLIGKYEPCGNPDCADHALWDCDCCFQVSYCSKECQRKHWDQHHQSCNFAPCKRTKKPHHLAGRVGVGGLIFAYLVSSFTLNKQRESARRTTEEQTNVRHRKTLKVV
ncbi:unknown protein [Seminavis robusta]|uniref:MYND-type domain-containing protein n=1 Tax=Seminavis robusta TaxID=568900 RepID=A0A9N8EZ52_9STRA|nr:unknown protein [Seminavis robusta]|eukprot:Sro2614_g332650.1 n/a (202) ;mRNA; r:2092-2697